MPALEIMKPDKLISSSIEENKSYSSWMQETKPWLALLYRSISLCLPLLPSLYRMYSKCVTPEKPVSHWYVSDKGEGEEKKNRMVVIGGWDAEQRGWKVGEWQVLLWPKCRSLQLQGQRSKWSWKVNLYSQEAHPVRDTDKGGRREQPARGHNWRNRKVHEWKKSEIKMQTWWNEWKKPWKKYRL